MSIRISDRNYNKNQPYIHHPSTSKSTHLSFPLLTDITNKMGGCLQMNTNPQSTITFSKCVLESKTLKLQKQKNTSSIESNLYLNNSNHLQINSIKNIFTDLEGHRHSVPPNVHTKRSQSPVFCLKEPYGSLTSCACIQYKVTLQLKPTNTSSSTHRHGHVCLPTCSPRLLRMLDSSMVQSPDLSCLSTGVKPRCTAWLQPPATSLPPSG